MSQQSPRRISADDLAWADLVLVMEPKHRAKIVETFREQLNLPRIISLDIPDEYQRMDPELIGLIRDATEFQLSQVFGLEPIA